MSLSNTITYPLTPTGRRVWMRGAVMTVAGIVLGIGIGLAISTEGPGTESSGAAAINHIGLSHDEFLRLNTTDLVGTSATASALAATPEAVNDPFIYQNVTSLDALAASRDGLANSSGGVAPECKPKSPC